MGITVVTYLTDVYVCMHVHVFIWNNWEKRCQVLQKDLGQKDHSLCHESFLSNCVCLFCREWPDNLLFQVGYFFKWKRLLFILTLMPRKAINHDCLVETRAYVLCDLRLRIHIFNISTEWSMNPPVLEIELSSLDSISLFLDQKFMNFAL